MSKSIITALILATALTCGVFADSALANNIRVENVSFYKSEMQPAGTIDIKFDVTWDNTYGLPGTDIKDANSQSFYDRAWIFVKFWNSASAANTAWSHAVLTTGGTLSTYSATTGTGISADGMGAFAACGTGQTVRWNYGGAGGNGLAGTEAITLRVMAIEMVYIPTGAFYAGDGTTSSIQGQFRNYATATSFNVSSEGAVTLGGTASGNLWNNNASGMDATADDFGTSTTKSLPAEFPKGYNGFYLMKYEVSEKEYVDFLNTLTRAQQQTRIRTTIATTDTSVNNIYVLANASGANASNYYNYRNTVNCSSATAPVSPQAITASVPIVFYTLRPHRACNYLSTSDAAAYADWAGLRPMTELEFEKAARGGAQSSVIGEGAWGTTSYTAAATISGTEDGTETITTTNANFNYVPANSIPLVGGDGAWGPLRCGIFAKSGTTRAQSGAGYYGNMDLTGNLWERCVTVGNTAGRAFTGLHGDGSLDATGNANVTNWGTMLGARGGGWSTGVSTTYGRLSGRYYAAQTSAPGTSESGIRCARTSPSP